MFTRDDFFSYVLDGSYTVPEKTIALLSARGFLIETTDDGYCLSDNSHAMDEKFLDSVLVQYNIGRCIANKIHIENPNNYFNLIGLFTEGERISFEVCTIYKNWKQYKRNLYGEKVPLQWLEPFIAMYVKALSACGLSTSLACDGKHLSRKTLSVEFSGRLYELWHSWIVDNVTCTSDLTWNKERTKISFNKDDQYYVYHRLLRSANTLYENRIHLRELRRDSCQWMTKKTTRGLSDEEIFSMIVQRSINKI